MIRASRAIRTLRVVQAGAVSCGSGFLLSSLSSSVSDGAAGMAVGGARVADTGPQILQRKPQGKALHPERPIRLRTRQRPPVDSSHMIGQAGAKGASAAPPSGKIGAAELAILCFGRPDACANRSKVEGDPVLLPHFFPLPAPSPCNGATLARRLKLNPFSIVRIACLSIFPSPR